MIESIGIKNYKSIIDLQFDVGRVNVFIGENGSGKSNILEAIALAAAAAVDKLDNEFLSSRGIRITAPSLMRSGFINSSEEVIEINTEFSTSHQTIIYKLSNQNKAYSQWEVEKSIMMEEENAPDFLERQIEHLLEKELLFKKNNFQQSLSSIPEVFKDLKKSDSSELRAKIIPLLSELTRRIYEIHGFDISLKEESSFGRLVIFSPEETALRNFYQEGQIEPLGIHGEGLRKLIGVLKNEEPDSIEILKDSLSKLSWFRNIEIPDGISDIEEVLSIQLSDRFIEGVFDQRSANEGFLFVLFYTVLFVSNNTPPIFAIDNLDASLNPKLCTRIIGDIITLAKQFDKQCFLTAHNPAVLDGIDLGDDEQRLFVVSRSRKGHTRVKRIGIESKPVSSTGEDLKLSEAFLRGYLGGLPKNF